MDDVGDTAAPSYYGWLAEIAPVIGAVAAVIVACLYGPPLHAWITLLVMTLLTGFGVTLGFHRLFAHRSFATVRPVECILMILGCMGGGAPFFWVATHRAHHRHSDRDGDPHSPHIWAGHRLGQLRGIWHAYFEWLHSYGYSYQLSAVRDLTCRRDLVWIDRHWFLWYLVGLAAPGLAGFLIGGTAYDALIGFLLGGLSVISSFFRCHSCSQHGVPPVGVPVHTTRPTEATTTSSSNSSLSEMVGITISRLSALRSTWFPLVAGRPHLVRNLVNGAGRPGVGCQAATIV
jgi:fatty-acid desaturase